MNLPTSMRANSKVIDWLLEVENPSVRYRTLTELLGHSAMEPGVIFTKKQIASSSPVTLLFSKMNPEGFWAYNHHRRGLAGEGLRYHDFWTTHFNLAHLAELAMDREDARVDKAVNRYLGLQQPDGDFDGHMSCLYSYNLRTFVLLGYARDKRVRKLVSLLVANDRFDGGFLCDALEGKHGLSPTKSCIRGSVKALAAYAEFPELWASPRCKALVDYFLKRHGVFRSTKATSNRRQKPILPELAETRFPFVWRATVLEILYALSRMGHGRHPALDECWALLESHRDGQGRYILSREERGSYFVPNKQGDPCKWITLYALLAHKSAGTLDA